MEILTHGNDTPFSGVSGVILEGHIMERE